jgi:hypothetical protein
MTTDIPNDDRHFSSYYQVRDNTILSILCKEDKMQLQ